MDRIASPSRRPLWWLVALFSVTLAGMLTLALWQLIRPQVSPLFFAAVMVSAWYGGLRAGLLATALAGFASVFFFMEPAYSLQPDLADALRLAVFLLVALLISWLNAARMRAEEQLREAGASLEARVADRTAELVQANRQLSQEVAERTRAERELVEHREQLRTLASDLSLAGERERRRIAAQLHDDLGQILALSQLKLSPVRAAAPAPIAGTLDEVCALLDEAVTRTRSLTCELSPPILYELGFEPAIGWLRDQAQARSGIEISLDVDAQPAPLGEELAIFLFQSIRELLNNMVKHSKARHGSISIHRARPDIRLTVEDDGVGCDPAALDSMHRDGNSFGLFNLKERLRHYNGRLELESTPGRGSRFILSVPLAPDSKVNHGQ